MIFLMSLSLLYIKTVLCSMLRLMKWRDRFNSHRRTVQYFDYHLEGQPVKVFTKAATGNKNAIDSNFQQKALIQSRSNSTDILNEIAEGLIIGDTKRLQEIYCY